MCFDRVIFSATSMLIATSIVTFIGFIFEYGHI